MGWRELLASADAQIPGYRRVVLEAAEKAGASVNWRLVESRLKTGQWTQAAQTVAQGWAPGAQAFESALFQATSQAMAAGAALGQIDAPVPTHFGLGGQFRLVNPSAVLWASTRSSNLIVQIQESQRNAVRDIVAQAVAGGGTAETVARQVRAVVGLDPRRAAALGKFAQERFTQATTPKAQAAAAKAVERYRKRLLRSRGEVIARTEVLSAMHAGQLDAWTEAKNRGEIGAGMVKRWIVTPDDRLCPYCAPLQGQQVQPTEPFKTTYGPKDTPPAHPQCRCVMALVRGKPTEGKGAPKPFKGAKPFVPPPAYPRPSIPDLPRSVPPFVRPAPPVPSNLLKLRSLGVDDAGKVTGSPFTVIDPAATWNPAHLDYLNDAVQISDLPTVTVKMKDIAGIVDTTAAGAKAAQIESYLATGTMPNGLTPTVTAVRWEGKTYIWRGNVKAYGEWANGADDLTMKLYDLDDFTKAGWPKVHDLKQELGFNEATQLFDDLPGSAVKDELHALISPDDIIGAMPNRQASELFPDNLIVTKGAKSASLKGTQKALTNTTDSVLVFKQSPVPGYTNYYVAPDQKSADLMMAAKALGKPVKVEIVDIDDFVQFQKPALKLKAIEDPNAVNFGSVGNLVDVPFPKVATHNGIAQTAWDTAIKKTPVTSNVIVDLKDIHVTSAFAQEVAPTTMQFSQALPTIFKADGKYWVESSHGTQEVLKAWAKSAKTIVAKVVDLDPELAAYKASKKAAAVKHAAKKKAAKTGASSTSNLTPSSVQWVQQNGLGLDAAKKLNVLTAADQATAINHMNATFSTNVDDAIAAMINGQAKSVLPGPALSANGVIDEINALFGTSGPHTLTINKLKKLTAVEQKALVDDYKKGGATFTSKLNAVIDAKNAAPVVPPPVGPPVIPSAPAVLPQSLHGPAPAVDLEALVKKQVGPQGGSNPGGLFEAPDGSKWYVKFYPDAKQAQGEMLANRIYNDLGIGAPQSVSGVLADGRQVFASKYLDDVKGTVGNLGMTKDRADQILDGFVGDVLTANWDAVGTGLDNVVVLGNGQIRRIDQGGSFLFRAKAGLKPDNVLDEITEWDSFINKNVYYKQVFDGAGISSADDLGAKAVKQIDHVLALQKSKGGWKAYVDDVLPQADPTTKARIVKMLDARTKKLAAKRTEILNVINAPPPPPRVVPVLGRRSSSDVFGAQLNSQNSYDDAIALSLKAENASAGSGVTFDGGDIEGFEIRVRQVADHRGRAGGKPVTEFKFKLTGDAKTRATTKLAAEPGAVQPFHMPKQSVQGYGQRPHLTGTNAHSGISGKTYKVQVDADTEILFHRPDDSGWAYDGTVQIFVKNGAGTPDPKHLKAALDKLGVRSVSYPTDAQIAEYGENAFVRLFQTGVKDLNASERAKVLTEIKTKVGITPADIVLTKDDFGRPRLQFTDAATAKLKAHTKITHFSHSLSSSSESTIMSMIENGGLSATTTRYSEGIGVSGMSSSSDIQTGGADYIFTRQHTGAKTGRANVTLSGDLLRRLDWFAYASDTYGAQNPNSRSGVHSRNNLQNVQYTSGSQETMFKHRIDWDDIDSIRIGDTAVRNSVIAKARAKGITHLGRRRLEDIFK